MWTRALVDPALTSKEWMSISKGLFPPQLFCESLICRGLVTRRAPRGAKSLRWIKKTVQLHPPTFWTLVWGWAPCCVPTTGTVDSRKWGCPWGSPGFGGSLGWAPSSQQLLQSSCKSQRNTRTVTPSLIKGLFLFLV